MGKRNQLIIVAALLVLVLTAGTAMGGGRELVVGVEDQSYRPFYWVADGKYQGPGREILDAYAAKRGDIQFSYRPVSADRLFPELKSGRVDLMFPDDPLWQAGLKRGAMLNYSEAVIRYTDGVMVRPEQKGNGLTRLRALGTVKGFTVWEYMGQIKTGSMRLVEFASLADLLRQALEGRIDGAYLSPLAARYQLEQVLRKPGALVFDPDLPYVKGAYRLSTIEHPNVVEGLDQFLAQENETVEAILKKHGITGE